MYLGTYLLKDKYQHLNIDACIIALINSKVHNVRSRQCNVTLTGEGGGKGEKVYRLEVF